MIGRSPECGRGLRQRHVAAGDRGGGLQFMRSSMHCASLACDNYEAHIL